MLLCTFSFPHSHKLGSSCAKLRPGLPLRTLDHSYAPHAHGFLFAQQNGPASFTQARGRHSYSHRAQGNEALSGRYLNILSSTMPDTFISESMHLTNFHLRWVHILSVSLWSEMMLPDDFPFLGWEIARRDLQASSKTGKHTIRKWEYSGGFQWHKLNHGDSQKLGALTFGV